MTRQTRKNKSDLDNNPKVKEAIALLKNWRRSILAFVKYMWGLDPQPVLPQFASKYEDCVKLGKFDLVKSSWFAPFEKGRHISWQQTLVCLSFERAMRGEAPKKISVASGNGIGKSAVCSVIVLWFLTVFKDAQVPVTAPTSHQMHDVLWKELSIWISRMPEAYKAMFEWTNDYVRVVYNPEAWFARARTSTKENVEAIAGVHSDHVLVVADEAAGVPEPIFQAAEGALTSGNVFVFLIANPTRLDGYFYDTHHRYKQDWQILKFSSADSPLVSADFIETKAKQYGVDSDHYKIFVDGEFANESMMDTSGYITLIPESKIITVPVEKRPVFIGRRILAIDPAGEGKDKATFAIRDGFSCHIVHEMKTSNPRQIAERALTLQEEYKILPNNDIIIDGFGVGATVGQEIAIATEGEVVAYTLMVGNKPEDEEKYNGHLFKRHPDEVTLDMRGSEEHMSDIYLNIRALLYFRMRGWMMSGGAIGDNSTFKNEVSSVKYKRSLHGNTIQLMPKKEMLKLGIPSPNCADACALTFIRDISERRQTEEERRAILSEKNEDFDPYSGI